MRSKLTNAWDNLNASLWFIPALLTVAAAGLSTLLLYIDARAPDLGGGRVWLFGGTADSARTLLSTVAGSLITVASLAFSITIVAVQQASTQFSPRVIRNFMRDRGNQTVFGVYIATFAYALLVLRQVREPGEGGAGFVPALSITGAIALALLCVALLIYYIHHIATSLQVATIADNIRRELREGIEELYPAGIGEPLPPDEGGDEPRLPAGPPAAVIRAEEAGFLRAIDEEQLLAALGPAIGTVRVRPQVGAYVPSGTALAELWPAAAPAADGAAIEHATVDAIRQAFTIDRQRSQRQDLLFGIRQLVDIALKAISPGINDPTTAEQCLSHLGDTVGRLAGRAFPPRWRRAPGSDTVLVLNRPDFAAIVDAAFSQIRREAQDEFHVTGYLLHTLEPIAQRVPTPERAAAIRHQVEQVLAALESQSFTDADKAALRELAGEVLGTLDCAAGAEVGRGAWGLKV